jgi:hypothetical protein
MRVTGQRAAVGAAVGAAVLSVLAVSAPILSLPPVAEDLQWALRGATVLRSPASLAHTFHQHLRPAGDVFFAGCVAVFDGRWGGYRAAQLAVAGLLALAGWALARRLLASGPWVAAALVPLWLICPLSAEVFCVTNQVKQMMLGVGLLGVLALRLAEPTRARRAAVVALAVLAAAAKEEWVVLPALIVLADTLVLGLPARRAARRALPWAIAVAAYLAAYSALTSFRARAFYDAGIATAGAKLLATLASFWHLADPAPLGSVAFVHDHLAASLAATALTAALAAWLAVRRNRAGLFALASAAVLMAPTAAASEQAGRYTMLPWLFALVAFAAAALDLWALARPRPALGVAAGALVVALVAREAGGVRRDLDDWAVFGDLCSAVPRESGALLTAVRAGRTLVVLRGGDGGPLAELAANPRGRRKAFFPRPDDPYGAVALQAVLSWELRHDGVALERVRTVPPGVPVSGYVHEVGGYRAIPVAPGIAVRHPSDPGRGIPGVILRPVPLAAFDPEAFP